MKIIRVLIAAAAALTATVAVQMATSSGASAAELHAVNTTDCTNCWFIVSE